MFGIIDTVQTMDHGSTVAIVKGMGHESRTVRELVVPAMPMPQYVLTETAAATIWQRQLSGDAARGVCRKYETDESFVDSSMSYRQIAESLWQKAAEERYEYRYNK